MDLNISTDRVGPWSLVKVAGELDMATAGTLKTYLKSKLSDGSKDIALELSELSFIDSSGLGALMAALRVARLNGGSMVLVAPGTQTIRVLQASGLISVLTIYSSTSKLPEDPARPGRPRTRRR